MSLPIFLPWAKRGLSQPWSDPWSRRALAIGKPPQRDREYRRASPASCPGHARVASAPRSRNSTIAELRSAFIKTDAASATFVRFALISARDGCNISTPYGCMAGDREAAAARLPISTSVACKLPGVRRVGPPRSRNSTIAELSSTLPRVTPPPRLLLGSLSFRLETVAISLQRTDAWEATGAGVPSAILAASA